MFIYVCILYIWLYAFKNMLQFHSDSLCFCLFYIENNTNYFFKRNL